MAEGAPDNRYINTDYLAMENGTEQERKIYKLTEAFKKHYLAAQQNADGYTQLYLDLPRFRKKDIQVYVSDNPLRRWWERVRFFFLFPLNVEVPGKTRKGG